MDSLGGVLRDGLTVLRDAARLLWRHWPVLLVLYLLGMAGRELALYLAVEGSAVNVWLGAALLPFAPLSVMVAILLMLDAVGPSLWHGPVRQDRLTLLAGTLVPFLAVYSAQGYLGEDRRRFLNESIADEYNNDGYWLDPSSFQSRTIADVDTTTILVVILVVLLLRRGLDWSGLVRSNQVMRLVAAWLEVAWMTWLASLLLASIKDIQTWLEGRVFLDWMLDTWQAFLDLIGPLAGPAQAVASWTGGLLTDIDALVVVPLAWLTTGAVVYGGTLASRRLTGWTPAQLERARARVEVLPGPVRSWLASVWKALFGRFSTLLGGLRTLSVGGVVPMVLFCLAFLIARYAELGMAELVRVLLGPMSADKALAFNGYVQIASAAVPVLLQVVLVAAAVDRLLVTAARMAAAQPETSAAPTTA